MPKEPDHRAKLLEILSRYEHDPTGQPGEELFEWACKFVSAWHAAGLSPEKRVEIADEGIASSLEVLRSDDRSLEDKAQCLVRALERHKKSQKRDLVRWTELDNPETGRSYAPVTESHETLLVLQDFLEKVSDVVLGHFFDALDNLKDRDHDLILTHYRLTEEGLDLRLSESLTFPTDQARDKALYRARTRFRSTLSGLLRLELARIPPQHREVLEAAIKVVEADELEAVLAIGSLPSAPKHVSVS